MGLKSTCLGFEERRRPDEGGMSALNWAVSREIVLSFKTGKIFTEVQENP